jgi:Ca2+-dependent lipid-binding protein
VPNPVGHLEVEVVEAVNLTAADFGGKSDPYVIMV